LRQRRAGQAMTSAGCGAASDRPPLSTCRKNASIIESVQRTALWSRSPDWC